MTTRDHILAQLRPQTLGWNGGVTSFELAEALGLNIGTVRRVLRELASAGSAYACAPRKFDRTDDRTAATLVWFRA